MALSLLSWSSTHGNFSSFDENESDKGTFSSELEFAQVIKDTLRLGMNVLLACNFDNLQPISASGQRTVDVYLVGKWIPSDLDGTLSLMLQLSHIISISWGNAKKVLRFINIISEGANEQDAMDELKLLSRHTRIAAKPVIVRSRTECLSLVCEKMPPHAGPTTGRSYSMLEVARQGFSSKVDESEEKYSTQFYVDMNAMVHEYSGSSDLVFMVLPNPHEEKYLNTVRTLVNDLPPTILVGSGRRQNVIPQEL